LSGVISSSLGVTGWARLADIPAVLLPPAIPASRKN
jgi:hypothetical protein